MKEYVLPWEKLILDTAIKDKKYGIYITNPNVEIILLITRMVVKSKYRDWLMSILGLYKTHPSLQKEYIYLKEKITLAETKKYIDLMYPENKANLIIEIIKHPTINSKNFRKLSKTVRNGFKINRRMSGFKASILSLIYKSLRYYRLVLKKLGQYTIVRKTTVTGGKIFCFIGVDGSGKSTLTKDINNWLNKGKIDNRKIYMGSGDGKKPFLAQVIGLLRKKHRMNKTKIIKEITSNNETIDTIKITETPIKYIKTFLKAIEVYSVAKGNRKK